MGIFVSPVFKNVYKDNFTPLFSKIREDLTRWDTLPISWLGKMALIKMTILPKLLYPIQMIPILFSKKVLKDVNGWLSSFIWSKRKPRLQFSALQLAGSMGVLDFLNIKLYQWSAHLRYVSDWVSLDNSWLDLEQSWSK